MVHICLTSENEGISLERYAIFAREGEFRVKRSGMLDVSFIEGRVNHEFWSRSGYSRQKATILAFGVPLEGIKGEIKRFQIRSKVLSLRG